MGAIVWLASYPKSGNTWTRAFLHNLLRPQDDTYDLNEMNELTTGAGGSRWYAPLLKKPLKESSFAEVAAVRAQAQAALAAAADGLVFAKSHSAYVTDHGAPAIAKDATAGAVYILRNPLDVASSYASHLASSIDKAIALMNRNGACTRNSERQAYEPMGSWSEHVESWTHRPHRALHIMRYEDMLARPKETFGALCMFLRIQLKPGELAEAIEKSSFDRLRAHEEEHGFKERPERARQFFRQGRAGTWRDVLTSDQVARIVGHHRDAMARFGYLPD
jgi:hypothetical protein